LEDGIGRSEKMNVALRRSRQSRLPRLSS
jgi:hypothetical protein